MKIGIIPLVAALIIACCGTAIAAPIHAIALYGTPKYPADFKYFDYVNPNAPKGGIVKLAALSSFDNLNPFILKGVKAPGIGIIFESLMVQSLDEPQTMYGLIAESIDVAPDHRSASFVIRKIARWDDGTPITPDDVVYSFNTIKEKGDPVYRIVYAQITGVEKTGPQSVKFTFADPNNRELPLVAAFVPIFSKAYYEKHPFDQTTLEPPMGSGPYKIKSIDQGRSIVYERVKDYWGADLPVNKGSYNFDEIRYDVYRDETVALEALKSGNYDFREEYIARNWATAYDFPAVKDGRVIKRRIDNEIPTGMQAFLFNLRKGKFADRRVREAIGLAMDFEWMNKTMFYEAYARNVSFFPNTPFAATKLPDAEETALLEPFREILPSAVFTEVYQPPKTDGTGNNRPNLLKAQKLLNEAGWLIKDGKRVNNKTGEQLKLEFMLNQPSLERIIAPMQRNLDRLGIDSTLRSVDDSQYQKRVDTRDFDVISIWYNRSLFYPGNEQKSYWYSTEADVEGSNNLSGLKHPAVDMLLDKILAAKDEQKLGTYTRALDRVLQWEQLVIPHWHAGYFRVAYWDKFGLPEKAPKYALGFNSWWVKK